MSIDYGFANRSRTPKPANEAHKQNEIITWSSYQSDFTPIFLWWVGNSCGMHAWSHELQFTCTSTIRSQNTTREKKLKPRWKHYMLAHGMYRDTGMNINCFSCVILQEILGRHAWLMDKEAGVNTKGCRLSRGPIHSPSSAKHSQKPTHEKQKLLETSRVGTWYRVFRNVRLNTNCFSCVDFVGNS